MLFADTPAWAAIPSPPVPGSYQPTPRTPQPVLQPTLVALIPREVESSPARAAAGSEQPHRHYIGLTAVEDGRAAEGHHREHAFFGIRSCAAGASALLLLAIAVGRAAMQRSVPAQVDVQQWALLGQDSDLGSADLEAFPGSEARRAETETACLLDDM